MNDRREREEGTGGAWLGLVGWLVGWLHYVFFFFFFSTYADTPEMRMRLGWDGREEERNELVGWASPERICVLYYYLLYQRCIAAVDSIRLLDLGRHLH